MKNGGSAYPSGTDIEVWSMGMSMRQRYKIAAMGWYSAESGLTDETIAKQCGVAADAMIAEDEEHAK